jgi:hypothetical protein
VQVAELYEGDTLSVGRLELTVSRKTN